MLHALLSTTTDNKTGLAWWQYVLIALGAIIVLGIVALLVNRRIRVKYNFSLLWGGTLAFVAIALVVLGIVLRDSLGAISYGLIAAGAILYVLVAIYDRRRLRSKWWIALLLQTILCAGYLVVMIDYLNPKSSNFLGSVHEDYVVGKRRKKLQRKEEEDN